MSSTDENVAHRHNRILPSHKTINIYPLVLLPVAVMKHQPKATEGKGLFFSLQAMSVIEGVGGGNSSRRVKQKTGEMAAWWLTQVRSQLAFFHSLGPPAQGMVLNTVGWAVLHQLTVKTRRYRNATGQSGLGNFLRCDSLHRWLKLTVEANQDVCVSVFF